MSLTLFKTETKKIPSTSINLILTYFPSKVYTLDTYSIFITHNRHINQKNDIILYTYLFH